MRATAARAPGANDAERAIQEALVAGENLQADLRALEEQRAYLDALLRDLRRGRDTLAALAGSAAGEEVLLPVGAGTFVRATLAEPEKVLATLGAGVVLETTVDDASRRLEERASSIEKTLEHVTEESRKLEQEMGRLNAHLQRLSGG